MTRDSRTAHLASGRMLRVMAAHRMPACALTFVGGESSVGHVDVSVPPTTRRAAPQLGRCRPWLIVRTLPFSPSASWVTCRAIRAGSEIALGGPKERIVLALLVARANAVVSLGALIEGVWDGRPPRSAERTLQAYVARLRSVLEPGRPPGTPSRC